MCVRSHVKQCPSATPISPSRFSPSALIRPRCSCTICWPGSRSASSLFRWPWPSASPRGHAAGGSLHAVVAGFLISALGGSRTQIGGPTGAFVVIVAGIVARFGMSGLAMVTVMAGILLLGMGLTGLGSTVRFIPRMVVIGFTNGIAILIASTQIKDFFGLKTGAVPSEFLPRIKLAGGAFQRPESSGAGLGLGTLAMLSCSAAILQADSCVHCGLAGLHGNQRRVSSAGRDHRKQVRRDSAGLPPFAIPIFMPSTSCR
jgi:hypothetical protein